MLVIRLFTISIILAHCHLATSRPLPYPTNSDALYSNDSLGKRRPHVPSTYNSAQWSEDSLGKGRVVPETNYPPAAKPGRHDVDPWDDPTKTSYPELSLSKGITLSDNDSRYEVIERLGGGRFGDVWKAKNLNLEGSSSNAEFMALKFQLQRDKGEAMLQQEYNMYQTLKSAGAQAQDKSHYKSFPKAGLPFVWDARAVLPMDRLGDMSLHDYMHHRHGKSLDEDDIHRVASQMLSIIEAMHGAPRIAQGKWHQSGVYLAHSDIKPENILLDVKHEKPDWQKLYLVDFGLAKFVPNKVAVSPVAHGSHTSTHVAGTPVYKTADMLNGHGLSPRDDLEQLVYVLIHLFCGKLPWEAQDGRDRKTKIVEEIRAHSHSITDQNICGTRKLPTRLVSFMDMVIRLKGGETINYKALRDVLGA